GDLKRLTGDNPAQQARLQTLAPAWQRRSQRLTEMIQVRRDAGLPAAVGALEAQPGQAIQEIDTTLSAMTNEEQSLLAARRSEMQSRSDWVGRLVLAMTIIA